MSDVTRILDRVQQGDPKAAEELRPLVYEELRRLAACADGSRVAGTNTPDSGSQARCFAKDADGNLFVAGSGAGKWIVRKSAGGSGPWTTIDVFQNGSSATSPNAIAADAWGNVFVCGFALED